MLWIVWLTLGCTCPDFADIPIEDPHGITTDDDRSAIRQAIDDFATWTERESVCVPMVSVHTQVKDSQGDLAGALNAPYRDIQISINSQWSMYSTMIHELCHAIDTTELDIAGTQAEVFTGEGIDPVRYWTQASRHGEDFARFCEYGPRELETLRALDDACGDGPRESPRSTYLNATVYPGFTPSPAATIAVVPFPAPVMLEVPWGERTSIHDLAVIDGALLLAAVERDGGREHLHLARFRPDGSLHDSAAVTLPLLNTVRSWQIAPGHDEALLFADNGYRGRQYFWAAGDPVLQIAPFLRFPWVNHGILTEDEIVLWGSSVWRMSRPFSRWEQSLPPTTAQYAWSYPSSQGPVLYDEQNLWRLEGDQWTAEPMPPADVPTDLYVLGESNGQMLARWGLTLRESGFTSTFARFTPGGEVTLYTDCAVQDLLGGDYRIGWDDRHAVVLHDNGMARWVPLSD